MCQKCDDPSRYREQRLAMAMLSSLWMVLALTAMCRLG